MSTSSMQPFEASLRRAAGPSFALIRMLRRDSAGGAMLRRLLPAVLMVPLLLGGLRLASPRVGAYGTGVGIVLLAGPIIVVFLLLLFRTAWLLDRINIASKQAQEERDRFFTLTLDLLCVANMEGYFVRLNPSWEKTLGYTVGELLSKPYLEFIHPEDRASTVSEARKLGDGGVTLTFENRYRCKDGSYKWLLWNAVPLPEQRLIYGAARDITDRKQGEEEIRRVNCELAAVNKTLEHRKGEVERMSQLCWPGTEGKPWTSSGEPAWMLSFSI